MTVSRRIPQILLMRFKSGHERITATFLRFPFLISFGVITVLNLWFALHDRTTPYFNGVSAIASPTQAAKAWGWSDSGSYLQMGISQAKFGHLTDDLTWTAIFWPPGMSYINAFAIKMVGLEGQFIFVLATLTALLWALVMSLMLHILQLFIRFWVAVLVVTAIIQTDLYHQYLVRDAIIWSDGYAAAFICLTILFSYLGCSNSKIRYFALTGISLAVLAYIRGQYFIVIQFFVVVTVCLLGLTLVLLALDKLRGCGLVRHKSRTFLRFVTTPFTLLSLVSILACLPYLIWQKNNVGDISWDLKGKWHWTSTDAFVGATNWYYPNRLAGFVEGGGGGTACKVDPILCATINAAENGTADPFNIYDDQPFTAKEFSDMALKTLKHHPLKWLSVKFPYLMKYWDSRPAVSSPVQSDFPTSELSLLGLLILSAFIFVKKIWKKFLIVLITTVVLIGATIGPPFWAHFEVRYLVPIKLIGLVVFFITTALLVNCGISKLKLSLQKAVK
jgi:hypothetical protein